ncbi:MAG: tRNA lysidine(34) synthetase TilS [Lachnospiraceae bacterium]|nr:tRNA lysidine(34) synthetase TilS [Lachnospiraceae bacterium]
MEKKVLDFINENRMIEQGDGIVVGVSGGADSVCLLTMLCKLRDFFNLKLYAVHVNHHIRGEEADEDQAYVVRLCDKMGVECICRDIDAAKLSKEWKCSEEEAGRNARYNIFREVKKDRGADCIAVAHNLNDVSETILFNLFRGTGIGGLCGIKPKRDEIIRPILCLTRDEIESYLENEGINYRTDSTNLSNDYSRNKLRNIVIPYVKENLNKAADINIAKTGESMLEIEDYLQKQTEATFSKYVSKTGERYVISTDIITEHSAMTKRVIRMVIQGIAGKLKDITSLHIRLACKLFWAETGASIDLPYGIVVKKGYKTVEFFQRNNEEELKSEPDINEIIFENGNIIDNETVKVAKVNTIGENMETFEQNIPDLIYTKWIDCDKIKGALTVRKRQTGDYITIDLDGNTKKLKDYFINEKIPREERDNILLVADGSHIVWVVGYRLSSYYKVTEKTVNCLKLTIER